MFKYLVYRTLAPNSLSRVTIFGKLYYIKEDNKLSISVKAVST